MTLIFEVSVSMITDWMVWNIYYYLLPPTGSNNNGDQDLMDPRSYLAWSICIWPLNQLEKSTPTALGNMWQNLSLCSETGVTAFRRRRLSPPWCPLWPWLRIRSERWTWSFFAWREPLQCRWDRGLSATRTVTVSIRGEDYFAKRRSRAKWRHDDFLARRKL